MIDIDYKQYLTRMLPVYKRLPNRIKLFYWPFIVLQQIFDEFKNWRADAYYRLNITGQILSLQSLLNRKVVNANGKILVRSYSDAGIWAQLISEPGESYRIDAGFESENVAIAVALEGEVIENSEIDFYVYIPQQVNIYEVIRWVDNYKIAGKRYQIIQA